MKELTDFGNRDRVDTALRERNKRNRPQTGNGNAEETHLLISAPDSHDKVRSSQNGEGDLLWKERGSGCSFWSKLEECTNWKVLMMVATMIIICILWCGDWSGGNGERESEDARMPIPINSIDCENGCVLITGIAGFIGYSTALRLASNSLLNGTRVIGIDSFNPYYDVDLKRLREQELIHHGVSVIHGDLCDGSFLDDILSGSRFGSTSNNGIHTVLHLAAQAGVRYSRTHPEEYWRNNVQCTETLMAAIGKRENPPRVVYASSSSVYGGVTQIDDEVPFKETDSLHPQSVYAETKVKTEEIAQTASSEYGLTIIGLRFFTVYGPSGRPDMALWSFTEQFEGGDTVSLYNHGNMKRDFTFIDDIVDGIISALNHVHSMQPEQHQIFNLGKGNVRTLHEFVDIVLDHAQLHVDFDSDSKPLTLNIDTPGGEALFTSADLTKSELILHFDPKIELEIGIPRFMEWYHDQWLPYKRRQNETKYLLMTTFYINSIDPMRDATNPKNPGTFKGDISKYWEYIQKWYDSFTQVATANTDIVIIHDGLPSEVMTHFQGITFLDFSGYQPMPRRQSPNDLRYFHFQRYLNEMDALHRYRFVVTTDLHDVHFGRDPFQYLEHQLTLNDTALVIGHEKTRLDATKRGDDFKDFVRWKVNTCSGDIGSETMNWIKSNPEMAPNPGIIGGTAKAIKLLFDEMVTQFQGSAPSTENCNFGIFSSSLFRLCVRDRQCEIINDVVFHSAFKDYDKIGHVVYHK